MTALTAARAATIQMGDSPKPSNLNFPVAASTTLYLGSMVAINASGYLVPASASTVLTVLGVCTETVDNSAGAAAAKNGKVTQGVWRLANSSSTDALTDADIGQLCFAVDDNVVARTSSSGARPVAGTVIDVDSSGVYVEIGLGGRQVQTEDLTLVAAESFASKQYYATTLDTAGKAAVAATAGTSCIGIMQTATGSAAVGRVRTRGISKAVYGGTVTMGDKLAATSAGKLVVAYGADRVVAIARESGVLDETKHVEVVAPAAAFAQHAPTIIALPITLAGVTAADVLTTYTPGFAGRINKISFAVTTAVTTGAKAATLNMEIGATNLTGGEVALTSANCTPLGAVVAGSAITAANVFSASDTISVEAASVTAFAEGAGVLFIHLA